MAVVVVVAVVAAAVVAQRQPPRPSKSRPSSPLMRVRRAEGAEWRGGVFLGGSSLR